MLLPLRWRRCLLPAVCLPRSGIGKPSIFHALVVTFLHYFSWGLLTVPFIAKLSESFGDRAFLVDGLVFGIRGMVSFLTTPLLGALSDFRGRKIVMLLAVATTYSPIPFMVIPGWSFFVLVTLSGVFGNTYSASLAYVADVTAPQERSRAYGIMSATYGAGMALSPMLGNYLMDSFGTTTIMALSSATGFLNILFIIFAVPESLAERKKSESLVLEGISTAKPQDMKVLRSTNHQEKVKFSIIEEKVHNSHPKNEKTKEDRSSKEETAYPLGEERTVTTPKDIPTQRKNLKVSDLLQVVSQLSQDRSLLAVYLISFLGLWPFAGVDSCVPTYLKLNMAFSYGDVSLLVGVVALIGITSNLLLGSIMRLLGAKWAIRLGLVLMMVQLLLFGFATSHWVLWLAGILASVSTIIQAACSTVASLYAAPENQGAVLGVLTGIESLCDGLGPAVFGVLFYLFQEDSKDPQEAKPPIPVPFVVGALGVLVALFLTNFLKKESPSDKQRLYRIFREEDVLKNEEF